MRHLPWALLVGLAACGSKGQEITVSVAGVAMADLDSIRADLSRLKGVSDVRAGQLKEGQATFAVHYQGKGADLAADFARLASALKIVKAFDVPSAQVSSA